MAINLKKEKTIANVYENIAITETETNVIDIQKRNEIVLSIVENVSNLANDFYRDCDHSQILDLIKNNYYDLISIIGLKRNIAETTKQLNQQKNDLKHLISTLTIY